jgi:hypothetical protein
MCLPIWSFQKLVLDQRIAPVATVFATWHLKAFVKLWQNRFVTTWDFQTFPCVIFRTCLCILAKKKVTALRLVWSQSFSPWNSENDPLTWWTITFILARGGGVLLTCLWCALNVGYHNPLLAYQTLLCTHVGSHLQSVRIIGGGEAVT